MSGVMASMKPKIAPVRRASENLGRVRQAPLLTAAAKASVDIAKAITIVDNQVMKKWLLAVPDQNVEEEFLRNAASRAKEIEILASLCRYGIETLTKICL